MIQGRYYPRQTFNIIAGPGDRICDARIYSQCSEVNTSIPDAGMFCPDQHGEADDAEERNQYVA